MTDVGSARVEVEADVRNFARKTEAELNAALKRVKPDKIKVDVDEAKLAKDAAKAAREFGAALNAELKAVGVDPVDIKASPKDALAAIELTKAKLEDLSNDAATVEIRVKTLKALAELEKFKRSIGDVEVEVTVDKNRLRKTFMESGRLASGAISSAIGAGMALLPALLNPTVMALGASIAVVLVAGIGAVLGPLLAGVISGALLAGGAASLIGLAAFLLKGEASLKAAAKSLTGSIKKTFTEAAQPMLKPLVDALGIFQRLVVEIGPQVRQMFASIAPAIVPLANGLAGLIKNALPGFNAFMAAAGPLMKSLAAALPALGQGFSDFFSGIAAGGTGTQKAFGDFIRVIGAAIGGLGAGFGWLASKYEEVRGPLIEGFSKIGAGIKAFWAAFSDGGPAALQGFKDFGAVAGAAIATLGVAFAWILAHYPAVRDGVVNAFNAIKTTIENVVGFVQANQAWLGPLASSILAVAAAFAVWTAAVAVWSAITKVAAAIQLAFNAIMLANPIGLIVLAIVALVGALVWFFTQTKLGRAIWEATWGAIKIAAAAVADWFTGTVVPALTTAWNAIKAAAAVVAAWYQANLAPLFSAVGALIMAVFQRVQQAVAFLWPGIQANLALIGAAWSLLWTAIKTVWQAIGPSVFTAIRTYLTILQAVWTAVFNVLKAVVVTVFNVVKTVITTALAVITGVVKLATALIKGDWSGAWNAIKGIVSAVSNGITSIIRSLMSGIMSIVSSILNAVKSIWSAAWNGLKGIVSNAAGGVRSAVNSIKNAVIGVFSSAGSWLASAGRRIIDGLISGIKAGFARVRSTLGSLTSMLPDWKGPAAVDRKILEPSGRMAMSGFEDGLTSQFGSIRKTLEGLTGDLPTFTGGPTRGGDGASAGSSLSIAKIEVHVSGASGTDAGEQAAEIILERLAQATAVR